MREPIPTWYFALVVVRSGTRFLVVHEKKHGQRWYLPAGRVEPGETLAAAAIRETREETGVSVVLDGIVRVEHTPMADGARVRAIFVAHAADDTPPRATDDSLGAAWVTLDELAALPLRGDKSSESASGASPNEVRALFEHVARGAPIYPLSVIGDEGAPF